MQPATERYGRLRELFHALVDLDEEERERLLAALTAGDADLVPALRDLLAVGGEADAALAGAVGEEAKSLRQEGGGWVGRRIGPWQVERLLGHGGMGSVFLGRRADGAFAQQVALKLVRSGFASADLLRRFHAERRTLAALEHPNIARLLDGGATDDDQPYLVMEYVDGVDLEAHCDTRELPLAERIALFLAVCAAVEHAHRNLIVHRDLKPGNVLVTADGVPKLLDFGIAKLLAGDSEQETLVLTQAASTLGTVAYASPEQVRGEAVSTATDVYSLGVILYRLLAGAHPYPLGNAPLAEAARIVCEVEPVPPSRAVTSERDEAEARRRARELRGDLDKIVLKALEKDAARRYPSVAAFADDLRRHRDGLPVLARKASLRYRAGKFVQRNRWGVTAGALVVASLVAGLAGTMWEARRAREEARRAELEQKKAEQVSDFLERAFSAPNVGWRVQGGANVTMLEVLTGAGDRIERDLAGQPEVQAHLHFVLASTYAVLNESQSAKRHVEAALALDRRLYGELHPATAGDYAGLGWIYAGHLGEFVRGAKLMDHALALYARMPATPPEDYAEVLVYRSGVALFQGQLAEGTALAERAVPLARRAGPASAILPQALYRLGTTYDARGDVAAAEKAYREALAAFNRLPQPDLPERSILEIELGGLLVTRGQLAAAERLVRGALADAVRHLGAENPAGPILQGHLYLGRLAQAKGDLATAEAEVRHALALCEARGRGASFSARIGQLYLGRVLLEAGRHAEAERLLSEAHAFFRAASMESYRAQAEVALGSCLVRQDRFADAEPMLLAAHSTFDASQVPASPRLEGSVRALVELYERWGKPDRAASWSARLAGGR